MLKPENQPLQLLQSGQLLNLSDIPGTGLILQKAFHCEFVGPGAAIGGMFDMGCRSLYLLGNVNFAVPSSPAERREAFRRRISYLERLQDIALSESPLRRADSLLNYLEKTLGIEMTQPLPEELLAQLVGVFPSTLTLALQQYRNLPVNAQPPVSSTPI